MTHNIFGDFFDGRHHQDTDERHKGGIATSGGNTRDLLQNRARTSVTYIIE